VTQLIGLNDSVHYRTIPGFDKLPLKNVALCNYRVILRPQAEESPMSWSKFEASWRCMEILRFAQNDIAPLLHRLKNVEF
jgi:hypothetical protein